MNLGSVDTRTFRGPHPAEVARTVASSAATLLVKSGCAAHEARRHVTLEDGSILYVPGEGAPEWSLGSGESAGGHLVSAQLVDMTPLAVADRIRGHLGMVASVSLAPDHLAEVVEFLADGDDSALVLHLVPRSLMVERLHPGRRIGPIDVSLDDYRRSTPDPLQQVEGDWLIHLDLDHRDVVDALALVAGIRPEEGPARPVELTRHGVVLRCAKPARDVHLAFPQPLGCGCDLASALEQVLSSAFPNPPRLHCAD